MLNSESFRVYRSDDLIGVELGGALKNIVAIGAGIIDGLGLGDNAKSAFLTRGLHEISRFGVTLGAKQETFSGLAGVGDMIATAFSQLSRNRHVGEQLAMGRSIENIVDEMDQTPEGIHTTNAALMIAARHGIDMPITGMTARVMFEHLDPLHAIQRLMRRAPAPEIRATSEQ
jgi:glycerol-3-phosphate dehydrogenase (NAD(P)+)